MINVEEARAQNLAGPTNARALRRVRAGELHLTPHPVWHMSDPIDWDADPFDDKNWRCQLHMLRWLEPLRAAAAEGDREAAEKWLHFARSWFINNRPPGLNGDDPIPDSWSDMIEAVRVIQLVQAIPMVSEYFSQELGWLQECLEDHKRWLADASHIAKANHALHQHEGLLVCSLVLGDEECVELAIQRLNVLFDEQWDSEGISAEGAIAYHRNNYLWWHRVIKRIRIAGLDVPPAMDSLEGTPEELAHATKPDGYFVPIGDTDVARATYIDHPACQYVKTLGAEGSPPSERVRLYGDGYLFGRSGWGEFERTMAEETFFSLVFGRYKTHGHEDGGSLTFSARGVNWVSDLGKYSYTHHDPMRKYMVAHDHHSLVYLSEEKRGRREPVTLISSNLEDPVWDVTVADDAYRGTSIHRRVLFSTVGEYLVVIDTVRSDHEVTAVQRWQLGEGVHVDREKSSYRLRQGDENLLLFSSGIKPVSQLYENTEGERIGLISKGWKETAKAPVIEMTRSGSAFRFITVLAPSHHSKSMVDSITGLPQGYLGVRVNNGVVSEDLVIGRDTTQTFPYGSEISKIRENLAETDSKTSNLTGKSNLRAPEADINDSDVRELAREFVCKAREQAWLEGPNALDTINRDFNTNTSVLRLPQTMDLGMAACSADLNPESRPGDSGGRGTRGPLINWSDDPEWRPTFYDLPVISHRRELSPRKLRKSVALHTVDLGELVLPIALAPDPGPVLTVQFHGAIDRNKTQIPIFQRLRFQRNLRFGPTMNIADPTLDMSSRLRLGWYLGSEEMDLHQIISIQIKIVADALGVEHVVLQGGSGGGFAALQVGSFMSEASVLAFNPQSDIRAYHQHPVAEAFKAVFGTTEPPRDPEVLPRISVVERLRVENQIGRVYLVANPGDVFHDKKHIRPLASFLDSHNVSKSHHLVEYNLGNGHRSPTNEQYAELMLDVYRDFGIDELD